MTENKKCTRVERVHYFQVNKIHSYEQRILLLLPSLGKIIESGIKTALLHGLLKTDDTIVITAGLPLHTPGTTNMLRVHTITPEKEN